MKKVAEEYPNSEDVHDACSPPVHLCSFLGSLFVCCVSTSSKYDPEQVALKTSEIIRPGNSDKRYSLLTDLWIYLVGLHDDGFYHGIKVDRGDLQLQHYFGIDRIG